MDQEVKSERRIVMGYAVDIFGPLVALWVTRRLGISVFWGLALGSGIALVSTVVNSIRRRKIDGLGVLVLLEIAVSIVLLFYLKDPRLLLIKPSFYSAVAAVYLITNAFSAQPLSFEWSKPMATKGDPVRMAAWRQAWEELPQFRRAHKLLTLGWGLAAVADAVLRVIVAYRFPMDRAVWLSNLPHIAGIGIMLGVSALFGRWAGRLVDGVEKKIAAKA